ncbi:MAG: bifunctional folylpolyglutamate synthase/dihydrofolate synthase [Phycisphaerae bacterium]
MARSATTLLRSNRRREKIASTERGRTAAPKAKPKPPARRGTARAAAKPALNRGRSVVKPIKSYQSALDFIATLVNYERRPPRRKQWGPATLTRARRLLKELGNPQDGFRTVHIAGSKGKGSTAAMLAQMLANNRLKVGLYTSPHIVDVRERITINDEMISKQAMTRHIARIAEVVRNSDREPPTYFEILTAIALLHFSNRKVDVAIIETGLGGRYDATNLIKPLACALTSISLDHMGQLGDSLEKIAEEKAGIFKSGVPVVSAPQPKSVKNVLRKTAEEVGADLRFAGEDIRFSYRFESSRTAGPQARICVTTPTCHFDHLLVPLVGEHQAVNCGVAVALLDQLKNRGFELDDELSIAGLAKVRLQGRMEMLCEQPRVLGDGAHNAASIEALMRAIGQNVPYDSMVVIFGCCADKDVNGMLRLIRLGADKVIFTRIHSPRAADPQDLADAFAEVSGRMAQVASNLSEAMEIAQKAVTREDLICVTGSFYIVREAKALFKDHPHRATGMLGQTA